MRQLVRLTEPLAYTPAHNSLDAQVGFRKDLGTMEAIGTLNVLSKRNYQSGQVVYICMFREL